jgi:hypothetical protein
MAVAFVGSFLICRAKTKQTKDAGRIDSGVLSM